MKLLCRQSCEEEALQCRMQESAAQQGAPGRDSAISAKKARLEANCRKAAVNAVRSLTASLTVSAQSLTHAYEE